MDYTDAIQWLKEHDVKKDDGTYYEFGEVKLSESPVEGAAVCTVSCSSNICQKRDHPALICVHKTQDVCSYSVLLN